MPLPEIARWGIAVLFTVTLAVAAVTDVRDRRIPNWTVLACLGLFAAWALLHPLAWDLWALAAGVIAFAATFALYAAGLIGAGDSKLFAAAALFCGMGLLAPLALATALAGGAVVLLGGLLRPTRVLVMLKMKGQGDFGRGVPYGVAIALGAIGVIWAALLRIGHFPAQV